ncbi:hypothetical protein [Acidithiobacillus ferrivorans]|uniref:hypothetical protein n=1 Tax=Acidithiobacillus ferrivorans TaxID=160808 RepID=UPI00167FF9B6|nr:hypothetical protein [Acidithiobacillus ferrivorans]
MLRLVYPFCAENFTQGVTDVMLGSPSLTVGRRQGLTAQLGGIYDSRRFTT